jgi:hypothetical protein
MKTGELYFDSVWVVAIESYPDGEREPTVTTYHALFACDSTQLNKACAYECKCELRVAGPDYIIASVSEIGEVTGEDC